MRTTTILVAASLAFALVAFAGPASAHEGTNHGTIKVHDEATASPPQRNEPHVDCDFWIEGFNMADDSGHLVFYAWPPTGDKSEVDPVGVETWTGTPETDGRGGFHFLAGPFSGLTSGHYRVEAYLDQGHPGDEDHFAKAKMFWVHCDENGVPTEPPTCPETDLTATANSDGTIDVTVEDEGATFNLYRAVDGGDFEFVATLDDGETFTDGPFEAGTVLEYGVTAFDGETETREFCATAQATAIPFFTGPLGVVAAAVLGIGAYVLVRRKA